MPRTLTRPSRSSRSAGLASSSAPAIASSLRRTVPAAASAAPLWAMAPRLAKVPVPPGAVSVSGCRTVTASSATPS